MICHNLIYLPKGIYTESSPIRYTPSQICYRTNFQEARGVNRLTTVKRHEGGDGDLQESVQKVKNLNGISLKDPDLQRNQFQK